MKKTLIAAAAALSLGGLTLVACAPPASDTSAPSGPIAPATVEVPAGTYKSEPYHTSVTFKVRHIGLSNYTARFVTSDITLTLDPANPIASSVTAVIDPNSIRTDFSGDYRGSHPGTRFSSFDQALAQDDNWLQAGQHPEIKFQSTEVTLTGPATATISGELTIRGITKPVTLEAAYNGSLPQHPGAGVPAIGFSAHGTFKRSEFGMTYGIPPEGSTLGVGDDVEVFIEAELLQQAAPAAAP